MSLKISNKVIGFEQELKLFKNLFDIKKLPQTLMIQGLDGIGKYTFCLNLVSSLLKKNTTNIEDGLISDSNVLILKNESSEQAVKIDDIRNIINFCQLKSFDDSPKFIIIKNSQFLNVNSVNALLKLIEQPGENIYFIFTSSLIDQNIETLMSRCFIKKIFLNKKYYKTIIEKFVFDNNIDDFSENINFNDTPGIFLRKYFYNLNPNLEKLKKDNQNLFYKIFSTKILESVDLNLNTLKKIKLNLFLNNDIRKIIKKFN